MSPDNIYLANAIERANYLAWRREVLRYMDPTETDLSFKNYVRDVAETPGADYLVAFVNEGAKSSHVSNFE